MNGISYITMILTADHRSLIGQVKKRLRLHQPLTALHLSGVAPVVRRIA